MADQTPELDATRAAIVERGLVADASMHLTTDVAMALPFETLGPFKEYLKRFFSSGPWTDADAFALSDLVAPHLSDGVFEHQLDDEITLTHGRAAGTYFLAVGGITERADSIFDRVFSSPVQPEATPHPRKVKFTVGGTPSPGVWYRRSDPEPADDPSVIRLFDEPDVTDVMVAGDFVTVGLAGRSSWEERLEPLLDLVETLYWSGEQHDAPVRTREQLMQEAGDLTTQRTTELHLLDPDDADQRGRLLDAARDADPRIRRLAIAVLAESADPSVVESAVRSGYLDDSRIVRRTAIDAAADAETATLRDLFEAATTSDDEWIRWKAVRALRSIGPAASRTALDRLTDDPDFQVRLEVATALRELDRVESGEDRGAPVEE